jgi:hypothetical protein
MSDFVELEITLRPFQGTKYDADVRLSTPNADGSEAEVEIRDLSETAAELELDLPALKRLEPDWTAYGAALGSQVLGSKLGKAIADARIEHKLARVPLRIRLDLSTAGKELQEVHWESLRESEELPPLFASDQVLFSRYLPSSDRRARTRARADLRVLIAAANPTNLPPELGAVDVDLETAPIVQALGGIEHTVLTSKVTQNNLLNELRKGYDVLYLVCHGAIGRDLNDRPSPNLFLQKDDGTLEIAEGVPFSRMLADLPLRPRLVVLASCQSAGTRRGEAETALGPLLAREGIPAVIAMRGNISMACIRTFMPVFFRELALKQNEGRVDLAVSLARQAAVLNKHEDFWIPVLYLRLKSGRLWYVPGFLKDEDFGLLPSIANSLRAEHTLPLIGPGVAESIYGPEREISMKLSQQFKFPLGESEQADLPKVAQFLFTDQNPPSVYEFIRDAYEQAMRRRFPNLCSEDASREECEDAVLNAQLAEPGSPLAVLARMNNVKAFVTACYDRFFEKALLKNARKPIVFNRPFMDERRQGSGDPELKDVDEVTKSNPLLHYVYGTWDQVESLVLAEDDFFDFLSRAVPFGLLPNAITTAMTTRLLLFIGFSPDDWRFRVLFRLIRSLGGSSNNLRSRSQQLRHVAVQVNPDETTLADANRAKKYLQKYFEGATITIYWGTAADFMRDLNEAMDKEETRVASVRG